MTEAFSYMVEGVGEDILPGTIDLDVVDEIVQVTDRESFHANRDLARLEGVLTGGSGGLAVIAAIKYAEKTQKKENIVVLMPDSAMRYLTKQFNDTWMLENGFMGPEPGGDTVADLLNGRSGSVLSVSAQQTVADAVGLLRDHDISQAPVLDDSKLVGVIDESNLLDHLLGGGDSTVSVGELATQSFATAEPATTLSSLAPQLKNNKVVLAMDHDQVVGVISQIDLIERMAKL
jgi:cystathionine beta-synthase